MEAVEALPVASKLPTILHLDADAFFAAVEERDKPSLKGRPIVVGGLGGRGVVATCNYLARELGIHSAMPIWQARALATGRTVFLPPRFQAYQESSQAIMVILRMLTPRVEPVSIDEAFADLSAGTPAPSGMPELRQACVDIKAHILEHTGLTVSIGVGTSKSIAKIASDMNKPDGLTIIPAGGEQAFLNPLPISKLWGVGPATQAVLQRYGITTIAQLAAMSMPELTSLVGQAHGRSLWEIANGQDTRAVTPLRTVKSVSNETTFATDITSRTALSQELQVLGLRVGRRLQSNDLLGRTIQLKVRLADFRTLTRSETIAAPTSNSQVITAAAQRLLSSLDVTDGVRLLGVGVSNLGELAQPPLWDDEPELGVDSAGNPVTQDAQVAGPSSSTAVYWRPGVDVLHDTRGRGWVQGSGQGVVTVRHETRTSGPGVVVNYPVDSPGLVPTTPEPLSEATMAYLAAHMAAEQPK